MSQVRNMEGVFAVHKPPGITSADVLRDLQKKFTPSRFFQPWIDAERTRRRAESKFQSRRRRDKRLEVKLGHGGTLDPMATGVLIAGVGKGTKDLNSFLACTKTYEAVVLFGVATDSYDRVGKVVSRAPYEHVTREKVEEALQAFRGKIMQRPSIFSALKVQGKKLYEYAREGIEPPVEILKRPVEVSNLEILEWYEGGTHDYVWPTEEASGNEKSVAEKMLKKEKAVVDTSVSTSTPAAAPDPASAPVAEAAEEQAKEAENTTVQPSQSTEPHGQKRKLSPSPAPTSAPAPASAPESTTTSAPSPKRQKPDTTTTTTTTTNPHPHPPPPAVKLTMTVSSGFYVRSLSHDLGLALGSNAIMSELVRTRQGDFELKPERVIEYKDLEDGEEVWGPKLQGFLDEWVGKRGGKGKDGGVDGEVEEGRGG
ncbi:hypothetical protein FQN50_004811 [Emmonsiellopsis sp. PD_5]|nr:hypothetical protein FQN50_004811 [Emmonsiellopsis sp. PD_5]